ncbi:MAG: hypothetical protein JWP91_1688 [Fibrobacteres bacterium]|nr:hypothetical protein [Fibrobacterota bacterium]
MTSDAKELVIDFAVLIRILVRRWAWIAGAVAIGIAAGYGAAKLMSPKYKARVVFVPGGGGGMNQNLQALGMLTGKLGISSDASEPPFLSHFEDFLKTRNFLGEMRGDIQGDTVLTGMLSRFYGAGVTSSDSVFYGTASGLIKPVKEKELFIIEVVTPDPRLSFLLSQAAFDAFDKKLKSTRMQSAADNLKFIQKLAAETRREMEIRSDELRQFQENNHDASSPNLMRIRQGLMLNLKLAEEKYILTVKENEAAKIQLEKQEENLVLIDKPYFDPASIFPKPSKFMALGALLAAFATIAAIGIWTQSSWILGRETPG